MLLPSSDSILSKLKIDTALAKLDYILDVLENALRSVTFSFATSILRYSSSESANFGSTLPVRS